MPKENVSIFEIFGPVMIGPSSSHTAGVARIAFLARKMFGRLPGRARLRFFGSFATTWRGHGSDKAAIAGLLGIPPEDERLGQGETLLQDAIAGGWGFPIDFISEPTLPPSWHPNSLIIELESPKVDRSGPVTQIIRATSVGGGAIRIDEINGYKVNLSGKLHALLVLHHDEIGVIAIVSHILAANRINIATTSSHRKERGDEALLVVETDGPIDDALVDQIEKLPPIYRVIRFPAL